MSEPINANSINVITLFNNTPISVSLQEGDTIEFAICKTQVQIPYDHMALLYRGEFLDITAIALAAIRPGSPVTALKLSQPAPGFTVTLPENE